MTPKKPDTEHYFAAFPQSENKLGMVQTRLRGKTFKFLTAASVFSKKRVDLGTRLLIETMILPQTGHLLDVGCGYGAVGIVAAAFNPQLSVVMTDVNMRAVHLTRRNLELNKVKNAEVRHGALYEAVKVLRFNCILSNPPVSAGMETVKAIITQAPQVMAENASLQMVIRSKIGAKMLPKVFTETFGGCQVLARKSGYRVLMAEKR
ncbi:class I SAM-dependent methyltransferase [Candidatus Bathyarchaeota archaeon A05DMB-2]|nr:class I SAM-dependent methyltransferase [Candidatus Bathyarchaeota archaeon A05DMB-2]